MRAIGYIRVSTEMQAEGGVSLDAQRSSISQYCQLYELDLVDIEADEGLSGKTLDRPALERAFQRMEDGEAEMLVIVKLDRLTRSVKDLGTLLDSHFRSEFSLLSVADKIDTSTAAGRLVLNVLASVSEWEREAIGERTSAALQHKIAQGEHVGSPSLGFDMVGGKLVKNEDEAEVVERIQQLRAEGHTFQQIADTLTEEGHRTKRGGQWYPATVRNYVKRMA